MRGVEVAGIDLAVLFIAIILIIGSYPLRVWMFHKVRDDSSVKDLLDGLSMIGNDFLAFRLLGRWRTLSARARGPVLAFSLSQISGMFLLLVVWIRTLS